MSANDLATIKDYPPFSILKNHAVIVDKEFEKISKLSGKMCWEMAEWIDNIVVAEEVINGVEKANDVR